MSQPTVLGNLQSYLALLAREHQGDPQLVALLTIFLQGQIDNQNVLLSLSGQFNIATAVGWWLDQLGARIGQSRNLATVTLDDNDYRVVLFATIAANYWDGTSPGAYEVWSLAFGPGQVVMQDNQDMSISILYLGLSLSPTLIELLTTGALTLKPAAVSIAGYFTPSIPLKPFFGFGVDNATIGGWGRGVWAERIG